MKHPRAPLALVGLAALAPVAAAQLYAVSLDSTNGEIYRIDPADIDPATGFASVQPVASHGPGFRSEGSAFDGRYHYAENADNPSQILRVDLSGAAPTVVFTRTYTLAGPNGNLAADPAGVIWEIDRGTSNLYTLSFDAGSGTVSRTPAANLGQPELSMGDIAWGPDGLLYIATNDPALGNFVWNPDTGVTTFLGNSDAYNGLAWLDGVLYGSVDGFGTDGLLFRVDPATMGAIGFPYLFSPFRLSDLAGGALPDNDCDPDQPSVLTGDGSGVQVQTLFTGQHIDAGTVSIEIVGDDLILTYNTTGGWTISETHTWAGADLADMPQTGRGNPKIGHFPYKAEGLGGVTTHRVTIPIDELGVTCPADPEEMYYFAAHAVVSRPGSGSETAWADGDRFVERGMWGTFFSASMTCVCGDQPPVPDPCETAFATSFDPFTPAECFLDIDTDDDGVGDFDRWGWTIQIPNADATYAYPIYARADGCDLSAAVQVGDLYLTYQVDDDDQDNLGLIIAEYVMLPGYTMDEVHFYAGDTRTPLDQNGEPTVALDHYTHITDDFTGAPDQNFAVTYTYALDWAGDGAWIIAHALVCGDFE